ncbi:MAG: AMP phosphorylase [archaeon]
MKYKFKVSPLDISSGEKKIVVLHEDDAAEMNLSGSDRVEISRDGTKEVAIVDLTEEFLEKGKIGTFSALTEKMNLKKGEEMNLKPIGKPISIDYIKGKLDGKELEKEETEQIIEDIVEDKLSDIEMTAYITGLYTRGMSEDETVDFTKAIISTGEKLDIKCRKVIDKHCIGGVPGNRTTMLIVPIIAAAGLKIPKTSSRSITSPAGTADSMEVLTPVNHSVEKINKMVEEINGCIVWGGTINLAAADDKLIRVRNPLSIDPRGALLGSILGKKKAAGATHVLIDIPIGKGAKVKNKEEAEELAEDFMTLGTRLNMDVHCIITPGYDPIGSAVGPALEAREILKILNGEEVSEGLREKSLKMAGLMLEIGEAVKEGEGYYEAKKILESGRAKEKMMEIIKEQGGNPEIKPKDIELGKYTKEITADKKGRIHYLHTKAIAEIGKMAGAPRDKGAGLYLEVEKGDNIEKGDKLMTIYAESKRKLDSAVKKYEKREPLEMEKVILGEYTTEKKPKVERFKLN